jgi:hypothetical protein
MYPYRRITVSELLADDPAQRFQFTSNKTFY